MTQIEQALFAVLRAGLRGEKPEDPALSPEGWEGLLRLAHSQQLLPLAFDAACTLPSFRTLDREIRRKYRDLSLKIAVRQMVQTNEFLTLYLAAQKEGLQALVLKGIVCRELYPKPCLRPSVDEDLLVAPGEMDKWHRFLLGQGLRADGAAAEGELGEEPSYHKTDSPTYLEMHRVLLPSASGAYGDLNDLFSGVWERAVKLQVEDVELSTLSPTDHLLFLLCHAYKHFLHGGVGVRHVADIAMYAQHYRGEIDESRLYAACVSKGMEYFCAALFRIGAKYLGISTVPASFARLKVDEGPLLGDILSDGMFGSENPDRMHSSHITLEAAAAGKRGEQTRGLWNSLFPGKEYLQNRFPYARKHPWLLPAAWANRLITYAAKEKGRPAESLRIGRERVELLRQYKIIP